MTLLAPLWLGLGGLVLVVFSLHSLRRRRVQVPSLIPWLLISSQSVAKPRMHWRRISLPLLLQAAVVLLTAFALAQPSLNLGGRETDHIVYVIDASGSMRASDLAPSRFRAAAQAVSAEILAQANDQSRISVIVVGGSTTVLAARQAASPDLAEMIAEQGASDGGSDWSSLASLLQGIVRPGEVTNIVIATDGASGQAPELDESGLHVEYRLFAGEAPMNAGLTVRIAAFGDAPNAWAVEGSVRFTDQMSTSVLVAFRPIGGRTFLDWDRIDVTQNLDEEVAEFHARYQFPSAGTLRLSLPEDDSPHDNVWNFVLRDTPRRLHVLYVGEGNVALEEALRAQPHVELGTSQTLPAETAAYDLVVVDGVVVPQRPTSNVLWVGSGRTQGELASEESNSVRPTRWTQDHPLARDINWTSFSEEAALDVPPLPGAVALLTADRGRLIEARTTPSGREIRIAFDLGASGWTEEPSFPIFVSNILNWLGEGHGSLLEPSCTAGRPCPLPARDLALPIRSPEGAELATGFGPTSDWLPSPATAAFVPERAGLYTIGTGPGQRTLSVNPASTEIGRVVPQEIAATSPATARGPIPPLWQWLAAVAAVALLAEAYVGVRGWRIWAPVFRVPVLSALATIAAVAAIVSLPLPLRMPAEEIVLVAPPERLGATSRNLSIVSAFSGASCAEPVGVVALDGGGRIERTPQCDEVPQVPLTERGAGAPGLDYGRAIELAAAMITPDRDGRIILAADGNETSGELTSGISKLAARDIVVDVLPLDEGAAPGDVLVSALHVPPRILSGDTFPVEALVFSERAETGQFSVLADGVTIYSRQIDLPRGFSRLRAVMHADREGRTKYEALIRTPDDPLPENDSYAVIRDVFGPPRVAIVTPQRIRGEGFAQALSLEGLVSNVMAPDAAPQTLEAWLDYEAIVLMNVSAADFDVSRMAQIENLVRLHGRGLMILGGENTFGPGGYRETLLETLSPLSSDVTREAPATSVVFVVDRSGSMNVDAGGETRLEIAKQATVEAIEVLPPDTKVGVVMFNAAANLTIPLQDRRDVTEARGALAPIEPRGGTSLVVAVENALDEIERSDTPNRHLVVICDGLSQPMAFEEVLQRAIEMNVTLSIVTVGDAADVERLTDVARRGGGNFHAATDVRELPSIMVREARILSGSPYKEVRSMAIWTDRETPLLAGLPDRLPPIAAYMQTTVKPHAELHLATPDNGTLVPLMASWRVGNGRVLAFAGHGAGPGTASWAELTSFPRLWAQPLRHILAPTERAGLHVTAQVAGDEVIVDATFVDQMGRPVSRADVKATLRQNGAPGQQSLALIETDPGRYSARSKAVTPGAYSVSVTAEGQQATAAVELSYSAELDPTRADPDRLVALSQLTGGLVLTGEEVLDPAKQWEWHPTWRPWLLLMLGIFMVDLFLRYLPFGRDLAWHIRLLRSFHR